MSKDNQLEGYILNIIQNNKIVEQSDLQQILKDKGHDIPQATLSRRLKKLNIAKVSGVYKIIDYDQPHLPLILNMKISDSGMIILHTQPGSANSLGYFLDRKNVSFLPQEKGSSPILGTIAGDDTVLLITKSKSDIEKVVSLLQEDFPYITSEE